MKTQDAQKLLQAMQVLDVAEDFDETDLDGIVLTGRRANPNRHGPGPNGPRPASTMITPDHPQWATVLAVLTGAVDVSKQQAEAAVTALGVTRDVKPVKSVAKAKAAK